MTDRPIDRRLLLQAAALSPALAASLMGEAEAAEAHAAEAGGKLVVIAELVSKPDKADELRDIMVPFVEGARKEPGCEHYTLLEDRKQPGRFLTYEIWTDEAALEAHMHTPAIKAATPKLADILAAPFTQAMLKVLSTN
jgi:quinol monooxygenase YgiN